MSSPSLIPPLAAAEIERLGGENAVQRLVLAMIAELVDQWESTPVAPDEVAAVRRCAAQVRERINLLGAVRER